MYVFYSVLLFCNFIFTFLFTHFPLSFHFFPVQSPFPFTKAEEATPITAPRSFPSTFPSTSSPITSTSTAAWEAMGAWADQGATAAWEAMVIILINLATLLKGKHFKWFSLNYDLGGEGGYGHSMANNYGGGGYDHSYGGGGHYY